MAIEKVTAIRYTCDGCGNDKHIDGEHAPTPKGWVDVTYYLPTVSGVTVHHFCSPQCIVAYYNDNHDF